LEKALEAIGLLLYRARLMMSLYYVVLAIVAGLLGLRFLFEISILVSTILSPQSTKISIIIKVLEIVDMVMVVQLVWVVALAGFSLFVTSGHFEGEGSVKKPDWLDHVTTYSLKLKLAFAIISISGVHALKLYISGATPTNELFIIASIHAIFVASAIGIAYAERLTK
jgi:uncharacterized protein (TIGR00645 family)